jgi:hypothetical protein
MRNTVAWLGLVLMVASFVWMQWISKPRAGDSTQGRHGQAFRWWFSIPGHGGQDSGAKVGSMLEKISLDGSPGRSIIAVGRSCRDDAGWRCMSLWPRARLPIDARVRSVGIHFNEQQTRLKGSRLIMPNVDPARNADHLVASVLQRTTAQGPGGAIWRDLFKRW